MGWSGDPGQGARGQADDGDQRQERRVGAGPAVADAFTGAEQNTPEEVSMTPTANFGVLVRGEDREPDGADQHDRGGQRCSSVQRRRAGNA